MGMLIDLFISFFKIGLFSIGGGLAAMPLIQAQVVDLHGWLTLEAFTDLVTIAEMTPGPIAVNAATFVGVGQAGILGAIVATLGCISPACIIVSVLSYVYVKYKNLSVIDGVLGGLRPAIVALIATAGVNILIMAIFGGHTIDFSSVNYIAVALFVAALFVLRKFKKSPIVVMLSTGTIGGIIYVLMDKFM